MTDDDEAPAGLAIPKQYPPPDARALALLARLVPAGADGLDLPADDLEAADALRSLTLCPPRLATWCPSALRAHDELAPMGGNPNAHGGTRRPRRLGAAVVATWCPR